jgi:hypothetical protein
MTGGQKNVMLKHIKNYAWAIGLACSVTQIGEMKRIALLTKI